MESKEIMTVIKSLVREGEVTATYPERMMARVCFNDRDDNVSAELPILTQGSARNKSYFNYDVGDQVVCLFAANDETSGTGWIIGSSFNEVDKVPANVDGDIIKTEYADGTYMTYNRKNHQMEINCKGSLRIECGGEIVIKGKKISLN